MVALLTEGVDRNLVLAEPEQVLVGSPSSRRAWIEIAHPRNRSKRQIVALLTEGVDRNKIVDSSTRYADRRPPHGGRG